MSLENAKLSDSAHKDETEGDGARSSNLFVSGLFLLSAELILESSHARWSFILIFSLLGLSVVTAVMLSVVLLAIPLVMSSFVVLFLGKAFFLVLTFFLGMLDLVVHLLELVLYGLQELGEFHGFEVSATEVIRLFLLRSSDIHLLSDGRIHLLELAVLTEEKSVEQKKCKDTVESSPEGDV